MFWPNFWLKIPLSFFFGCACRYDPTIGGKKVSLLFSALDRSKSGLVGLEEFYEFFQAFLTWA